MKKLNLTILLAVLLSMVGAKALAYDIAVDNADGKTIYYNYSEDGTELTVTFGLPYLYANIANRNSYTGDVVIPEEVTIMNRTRKVTSIGNSAFVCCNGLTSVTIPNSVTSIGSGAFAACYSLTSVTIPDSVTSLDVEVFAECSNLASVSIGNSVTTIEGSAFSQCHSLTSVILPNSVTTIGAAAFSKCSSLTSVVMSDSIKSIGDYAFYECTSLTSINIPDSVVSIGQSAFQNCKSLISVSIGSGLNSIGTNAFKDCSNILSIVVSKENTKYDSRDNCNAIIETEQNVLVTGCNNTFIPNSVTSIGNGAFDGCNKLSSMTIPNSVTSIGSNAFSGCSSLTSLTIPNSVTTIGGKAFWCENLAKVVSLIESPYAITGKSSDNRSFHLNTFNNGTLYVPVGTKDKYLEAQGWNDFAFIEESSSASGEGGETTGAEKCANPTISYSNGRLVFSCETEGATCLSTITNADTKSYAGNMVELGAAYNISVYAVKQGYKNSDVVTATLTWSDSGLKVDNMTVESTKDSKGDVNGDGVVDVSDYIGVANIILYGTIDGK